MVTVLYIVMMVYSLFVDDALQYVYTVVNRGIVRSQHVNSSGNFV